MTFLSLLHSKLGECSAAQGCNWTLDKLPQIEVGTGATGAKIAIVGTGKKPGTIYLNPIMDLMM